jgi:hypothetical protein
MKKIIITAFLLIGIFTTYAQRSTFYKGDKVINASIGLGSMMYSGIGYSTAVPPISGSFELGFKDDFLVDKATLGFGAYMGYSKNKWESFGWGWTYTNIILGARASLHYPILENFDTYGGIMLGFNIVSSKEFGINSGLISNSAGSGIAYSFYVGGRYYLTKNFALLGELGYGIAWLNVGLSFKL